VRAELAPLQVDNELDVLGWFVAGEDALEPYVAGARVNTDNHPYLEFAPAMAYFASTGYLVQNLLSFRELRESPIPWVVSTGETPAQVAAVEARIRRRFEATQHSINGDVLYYLGRHEQARRAYDTALSIDPGDKNWAHSVWEGVQRPER
jgi:tetratricopeptide (TPR) repeat protein